LFTFSITSVKAHQVAAQIDCNSTSSDGLSVFAENFAVVELTDTQGVEPGLSYKNHMREVMKENQRVEVAPFVDKRGRISVKEV